MRILVILAFSLALAQADVSGYNYGTSLGGYASSYKGVDNIASLSSGNLNSDNISTDLNSHYFSHPSSANVELQKEIFIYSSPEDDFEDGANAGDLNKSYKKNLRVIFIRAPEHKALTAAVANLAKNMLEQKTVIYVLTKQTDLSDLTNKLQNLNKQNPNKPEVHFIKYRTPEEAHNAQRIIQQQYESLGGHNQVHNGGVAKVLNFANQGQVQGQPSHFYIPSTLKRVQTPAANYIPIAKS